MASTSKKKPGKLCSAIGCNNYQNTSAVSMFRFPKEDARCRRWVIEGRMRHLKGRPVEQLHKNNVLCADHFSTERFNHIDRTSLKWNAIPDRFPLVPPAVRKRRKKKPPGNEASHTDDEFQVDEPDVLVSPTLPVTPRQPRHSTPKKRSTAVLLLLVMFWRSSGISTLGVDVGEVSKLCSYSRVILNVKVLRNGVSVQVTHTGTRIGLRSSQDLQHLLLMERKKNLVLTKQLKRLRKRPREWTKQDAIHAVGQHLSGNTLALVKNQIANAGKTSHARRWTITDKSIALSIYHSSPKTYRILSKLIALPSPSTLSRAVRGLNIQPGFNEALLDAFRAKVKVMAPTDRRCTVVFDEMSIKAGLVYQKGPDRVEGLEDLGPVLGKTQTVATHALVFMARGHNQKWKQPLGYFLTGSTVPPAILKSLIMEAIAKCKSVGLTPVILLCDQGSNNRCCMEKLLGVTVDKPYFYHDGEIVFVMYDPPHLLKNVRNNFRNNGFVVDGNVISWEHIEAFYEADCKFTERLAKKITPKHLKLPAFSSMKVRYAAQILSESVADGIKVLCQLKILPASHLHTARLCELFDHLFNAFNSKTIKSTKPFMHAIWHNSNHWPFLQEAYNYIKSIRPQKTSKLPCLEGWLMNINALQLFMKTYPTTFMLTNRCNQDCVENLFFQIRNKGGPRDNPNAAQFRAAIRDVMVGMLMAGSRGTNSNCKSDADNFLLGLKDLSNNTVADSPAPSAPNLQSRAVTPIPPSMNLTNDHNYSLTVVETDEDDVDIAQAVQHTNILAYMGGYILRKIDNNCSSCTAVCRTSLAEQTNNATYTMIAVKENVADALYVPSAAVVQYIAAVNNAMNEATPQYHINGVRRRLIAHILRTCPVPGPLECCSVGARIVSLFTTIKLFQLVKLYNERILTCRKSRKLLKLSNI